MAYYTARIDVIRRSTLDVTVAADTEAEARLKIEEADFDDVTDETGDEVLYVFRIEDLERGEDDED